MTKHGRSVLQLAFVTIATIASLGCGRDQLDDGFPTTNVDTGSGGSAGRVATGGSGGVPRGTGGSVSTGIGGNTSTGGNTGTGGSIGGGIACGAMTCQSASQACCMQVTNGRRAPTCIPAGQTCDGGANIGCLGGDCGNGRVCCASLIGLTTSCTAPQQCANGLSAVLCGTDSDCPSGRRHCCQTIGLSICSAAPCGG